MHVHANMHTICTCKNVILIVVLFEFILNVCVQGYSYVLINFNVSITVL